MILRQKIAIFSITLLLFGSLVSQPIRSDEPTETQISPPDVTVMNSDRNGVTLNISLNGIDIKNEEINGEIFHKISLPKYGYLDIIGKPKLPAIRFYLAVPPEVSDVQVNIPDSGYTILNGYNVYPVQEPIPEPLNVDNFTINTTFYMKDEFYPSQTGTIESNGWIRDYQFILLSVSPIQCNPSTKELRVYNYTHIQILFNGSQEEISEQINPGFETIYSTMFLNYETAKTWYNYYQDETILGNGMNTSDLLNSSNRAGLLIITNDTFYNHIKPLAQWKDRKGWETYIANTSSVYSQFTESSNHLSIRSFIDYTFYNWSRTPSHVLLIGDVEYIPTYYYQGDTPSDHWYSCIIGNDYLPDIAVGRISVKNCSETSDIVDKIVNYEKNPYLNETDWYKKAMLVSDSGYFEVTSDWVYDFLINFSYTADKFYDSQGTATTTNIANAINEGRAIANYRGHGGTTGWGTGSFYNSDVLSLTNGRKLPIVISPTCSTGHFDDPGTDCFGETWLKATDKGGVSFWGSSRVSYGGYNDELDMGVYKAIFSDYIYDFGGFTNKAKLYMIAVYGTSSMAILELHLFNVIGDSTLEFWTDVPQPLNVTHPTVVLPQPSQFNVTVRNDNDMAPVEDALVCLQKGTELYTWGYTNATGEIQFNITTSTLAELNITVTKHNFVPYESTSTMLTNMDLYEGWNFISGSCNRSVAKSDLIIWNNNSSYSWQDAVDSGVINDILFGWNRTAQSYTFIDVFEPGYGCWIYAYDDCEIWIQSNKDDYGYITGLKEDWNIIGLPDYQNVSKTNLSIMSNDSYYNWSDAVLAGVIDDYVFGWDRDGQNYTFDDIVLPGYAYWMYAYQECTLHKLVR